MDDILNLAATVGAEVVRTKPAITEGRTLHFDGDQVCYEMGGSDDMTVAVSRRLTRDKIMAAAEYGGCERNIVHLTAESSTKGDRFVIAQFQPYQGQRLKGGRKPKNWGYLRNYLENPSGYESWSRKIWATREADDGMHYGVRLNVKDDDVVMSGDKDMRIFTGCHHMNWKTFAMHYVPRGTFRMLHDDKWYGEFFFWTQMLMGDNADHIPGCVRYVKPNGLESALGPKTAEKILADADSRGSAFLEVRSVYKAVWGDKWASHFAEQAALLWIRPDKDGGHGSLMEIMSMHPETAAAFTDLVDYVKEKYNEAHRLSGTSPARKDVG